MAETLYASFADPALAEKAAGALLDYGVRAEDISLVTRGTTDAERRDYTTHTATVDERNTAVMDRDTDYVAPADSNTTVVERTDNREEMAAKQGISTTTPGDAASGAAKGAGIGLGVGIAAAIASLLVPGFGLVAGGGALATAIAGAAGATAAGAVAGGVTGYLKDQGVPDEPAMRYNEAYQAGGAILAVTVPSGDADRATIEGVLNKYGASNIGTYGASTL